MGIFQDFLDSRPMTIQSERIARRELKALQQAGDAEAPSGFNGRTGWAILKILGLTNLTQPPLIRELLGYLPQDIDYQRSLISPDTVKVIINQIAIDDLNIDLEQDILIHLDLCRSTPGEMCLNVLDEAIRSASSIDLTDESVCVKFIGLEAANGLVMSDGIILAVSKEGLVLTADDYIHRWSPDQIGGLTSGDLVALVPDGGSIDIDLTAVTVGPTWQDDIFNGKPSYRFLVSNRKVQSASNVNLFPSKRGTVVWVGQILSTANNNDLYGTTDSGGGNLSVRSSTNNVRPIGITGSNTDPQRAETPPPDSILVDDPQIFITIRDTDTTIRFRRNGDEKLGFATADWTPINDTFRLGSAAGSSVQNEVGMFLVYDRVLSAGDLSTLESELATAFGITI